MGRFGHGKSTGDFGMQIRLMQAADRAAVAALLVELNRFEHQFSDDRDTSEEAGPACLAVIEATVARDGGAVIVADDGDRLTGVLALAFSAGEAYVRPDIRAHGRVLDLVVTADARGRGVGPMLLAEAERRTREAGLSAMLVGALIGNDHAIATYERFGFRQQVIELIKIL